MIKKPIRLTDECYLQNVKERIFSICKENWDPNRQIKKVWNEVSGNIDTNYGRNISTIISGSKTDLNEMQNEC